MNFHSYFWIFYYVVSLRIEEFCTIESCYFLIIWQKLMISFKHLKNSELILKISKVSKMSINKKIRYKLINFYKGGVILRQFWCTKNFITAIQATVFDGIGWFFFAWSVFDRSTPILRIRRRGGGGSATKSKITKNGSFSVLRRTRRRRHGESIK